MREVLEDVLTSRHGAIVSLMGAGTFGGHVEPYERPMQPVVSGCQELKSKGALPVRKALLCGSGKGMSQMIAGVDVLRSCESDGEVMFDRRAKY